MILECIKCADNDTLPCLVVDLDKDYSIPIKCPFSETLQPEFKPTEKYIITKKET